MKEKKIYDGKVTVLHKTENGKVKLLLETYKKDPYLARILFMNNTNNYDLIEVVLFEDLNGDYSIVTFRKSHGISKNNRLYNADKRLSTITYKKEGDKFWHILNNPYKKIQHLTIDSIHRANYSAYILPILVKKNTWMRYVLEKKILHNVSFNSIIKNKLYSYKKAIQFYYKVSYPIGKILHEVGQSPYGHNWYESLKFYSDYIKNVEALNMTLLNDNHLIDTIKMAKTLNKQVNLSWSSNRLKLEHDKWAKEITDIVFRLEDRELFVSKEYLEFSKYSKYKILTTTRELAIEGKRQSHCVATYANSVESHQCGIFVIDGFTLELQTKREYGVKDKLIINQFRGYQNVNAPQYLYNNVEWLLDKFNDYYFSALKAKESPIADIILNVDVENMQYPDDLPF